MCVSDYLAPPGSRPSTANHTSYDSYNSTPHHNSTHSYDSYAMASNTGFTYTSGYDTVRSRTGTIRANGNIQDEGGGTLKRDRKYSTCKYLSAASGKSHKQYCSFVRFNC